VKDRDGVEEKYS